MWAHLTAGDLETCNHKGDVARVIRSSGHRLETKSATALRGRDNRFQAGSEILKNDAGGIAARRTRYRPARMSGSPCLVQSG